MFEGDDDIKIPNGLRYFAHRYELDDDKFTNLPYLAIQYGTSGDTYLTSALDREYLWLADGSGYICFVTKFGCVNIVGGLVCPEHRKPELVTGAQEFAAINCLTVSFFNVGASDREIFDRFGFQSTHYAFDYRIDLSGNIFHGKPYRDLRQRLHSNQKKGVSFAEMDPNQLPAVEWKKLVAALNQLERENLKQKLQKEPTSVFQGNLADADLGLRRLFVAFSKDKTPEAFLILNPYGNGEKLGLDTYRYRVGGPQYVLRALIFHVMQLLKAEGMSCLSLGIVPGLNCKKIPNDSTLTRRLMRFWIERLDFIANISGVHHFKSRFRPTVSPRYVCVYPKATPISAFAFLWIWGGLNIDIRKLIAMVFHGMRNRILGPARKPAGNRQISSEQVKPAIQRKQYAN